VASGREATGHLHEIPTGFMFYWGNLILVWVSLKSEIQSCDQSLVRYKNQFLFLLFVS